MRRKRLKKLYAQFLRCLIGWLNVPQEVDENDLKTLDALLPANASERKTLADIIFSKLDNAESGESNVIQKTRRGTL
jgi:hypothetical protein